MKKLASVFAVITCVFALTACGSAKVNTLSGTPLTDAATEQSIISYGEQLVGSMDSIVRGGTIEEYSDDAVFGPRSIPMRIPWRTSERFRASTMSRLYWIPTETI